MSYAVEKIVLRVFGGVFKVLPRNAALALGGSLGSLAYLVAYRRRRLASRNLEMALGGEYTPRERKKIARESFRNLGMNVAEYFAYPALKGDSLSRIVTFGGEEHLKGALGQGRGVLILSAHLGNWDLLGAALALRGYPLALISKSSRSEAVNEVWMKYRYDRRVKVFKGRGTMKDSIRHLKNGGIVGFVLDQNARLTEGVFVPFFGKEACTLASLAILARRTGCPVVPVHSFRTGRGHQVVIEEPIRHDPLPDQELDILERTRAYTAWTEKVVRLHPQQWTWLHNRWKTRPRGELAQ